MKTNLEEMVAVKDKVAVKEWKAVINLKDDAKNGTIVESHSALHKVPSKTEAPDQSNTIQALENTSYSASVKVPKTKSKSELLDDKLSMPSNKKIEKTEKRKLEVRGKGTSPMIRKRGNKPLKTLVPKRIQQTLKKRKYII